MQNKRPLGITLIGYFYIFGIVAVLLSLFSASSSINGYGISAILGWQQLPEALSKLILIAVTLVVIYGFLTQKKWGFAAMVGYSIYFMAASAIMAMRFSDQPFVGNFIWSAIVLVYTLWHKKNFFGHAPGGINSIGN